MFGRFPERGNRRMHVVAQTRKAAARPAVPPHSADAVPPQRVIAELEKHILVDGFKLVFDVARSRGSRFVDAATGRELIDLYSFYASQPIGFNHPYFDRSEVKERFLNAGSEIVASSPAESAAVLKADIARWDKVIKDTGIRIE